MTESSIATTPKTMKNAKTANGEQQHLHGLGDEQHQDQVRLLQAGDLGLGLEVGALVDQPRRAVGASGRVGR